MINKTFNSDSTDGRALEVGRNGERPWLNIREFDLENTMFMLAPSDAPALALAVLEAAGVVPVQRDYESCDDGTPAHLQAVAYFLEQHNEAQKRITAEARERAELEAEALELFNTLQTEIHGNLGPNWVPVTEFPNFETKRKWLAVARRAREMRAEK